jgi:hypothetical protein
MFRTLASRQIKSAGRRFVNAEAKIAALGLEMPSPAIPKGNFVQFTKIGNMVYLSGHLPQPAEGDLVIGKVGKDVSTEEGSCKLSCRFYIWCARMSFSLIHTYAHMHSHLHTEQVSMHAYKCVWCDHPWCTS